MNREHLFFFEHYCIENFFDIILYSAQPFRFPARAPHLALALALGRLQRWLTDEEVDSVYNQYDLNKDGVIRCGARQHH